MIIVAAPPGREAERRLVLDYVLRERLGLEWTLRSGPSGAVTLEEGGRRLSLPDLLLGLPDSEWLTPASLPPRPLATAVAPDELADARLVDRRLPIVYGLAEGGWRFEEHEVALPLDLFGSIFFLLTRYEEVVVDARDEHGRFPAEASRTGAPELVGRPLADEYVELLWAAMHRTWPQLERRTPPGRLHLTHDVDFGRFAETAGWGTAARAVAGDLLKRREPRLAFERTSSFIGTRLGRDLPGDPYDAFDELMDVSERHGLRSAFYFVAARPAGAIEATYDIGEAWVTRTMRRIGERGHEIGLHASYGSHRDADQLRAELARLRATAEDAGVRQDAWGGRHHYLRWQNPRSWADWEAAGLAYDSSLGYAELPGFRSGTTGEHPAFDLHSGRPLALRERPLAVMDTTFRQYLHADADEAGARIIELGRRASRVGGSFTLLWHNSSLVGKGQRRFYAELVAELARIIG